MVSARVAAARYSTVKVVRLFQFPKTTNKDESGRNNRQTRDRWEAQSDSSLCIVVISKQTALKMNHDCASQFS